MTFYLSHDEADDSSKPSASTPENHFQGQQASHYGDPPAEADFTSIDPSITAPGWQHFHHGADIGVRGIGATPAAAFAQAALAMTAVITNPARVMCDFTLELNLAIEQPADATDTDPLELLLVDWLNSLIFEMAVRSAVFADFNVNIDSQRLRARVAGERVDPARHHPAVEVKGATLTCLAVRRTPQGLWLAQCVLDV